MGIKSFFSGIINPSRVTVERIGNSYGYWQRLFGGVGSEYDRNYLLDYLQIPELNAVINIRARAIASARFSVVNDTTGQEAKAYQNIVRVLRSPNWFQNQQEFWRQSEIYRCIYGNEFIYFITPVGMPRSFKAMYTLDPSKVIIEYKGDAMYFNEPDSSRISYYYKVNGEKYPLEASNLIHLNDNNVGGDIKNLTLGSSKLKALTMPLDNIRKAYTKRNIALQMPIGVMSNGQRDDLGTAMPMDTTEIEQAKTALRTNGSVPIITNLAVEYKPFSINSSSMGLFEEVRVDLEKICDCYSVPFQLLANEKGSTFSNQADARRSFYEEEISESMSEKMSAINQFINTQGIRGGR